MTMRKVFWSIAALAVVGAAGMYLAADHARRHPESLLGQATLATYRVLVYNNPIFALTHAASGNACQSIQTMTAAPSCPPAVAGCASVELEVRGQPEPCGPADLSPYRLPGRIAVNEEEETYPTGVRRASTFDEMVEWPLAGVVVELIPPPVPVEEEANGLHDALPPGHCLPFSFQPHRMYLSAETCVVEASADPYRIMPRVEDDAPAVMPYADEAATPAPMAEFYRFLLSLLGKTVGPADCCKDEPSESPTGGQPPECREDPFRHYQYPGCPSMGCPHGKYYCPYSGHRVMPAHEPEPRSQTTPRPAETPGKPPQPEDEPEGCAACRKGPHVDTMEFRPSDAKPGEFGLLPF